MYSLEEIRRYRHARGKKRLILDTNLLLLLLIGSCDKNFLSDYSCTEKYSGDDVDLLLEIFRYFESEIVITPHVLAEFSNLSIRDVKAPRLHYYLSGVIEKLKNYKEEHVSLERLLGTKVSLLSAYGFSDMSVIEAAKKLNGVILTDDMGLNAYATYCLIPNVSFSAVKAVALMKS